METVVTFDEHLAAGSAAHDYTMAFGGGSLPRSIRRTSEAGGDDSGASLSRTLSALLPQQPQQPPPAETPPVQRRSSALSISGGREGEDDTFVSDAGSVGGDAPAGAPNGSASRRHSLAVAQTSNVSARRMSSIGSGTESPGWRSRRSSITSIVIPPTANEKAAPAGRRDSTASTDMQTLRRLSLLQREHSQAASIITALDAENLPGVEGCMLDHFRIQCFNMDQTEEFYTRLGFRVDRRYETLHTTVFTFVCRDGSKAFNQSNVTLAFEYDKLRTTMRTGVAAGYLRSLFDRNHLVCYCRDVQETVIRMSTLQLGYQHIYGNGVRQIGSQKAAILIDPNGLVIRLLEVPDSWLVCDAAPFSQVSGSNRSVADAGSVGELAESVRWSIRIGHMVVHRIRACDIAQYYEQLFSVFRDQIGQGGDLTEDNEESAGGGRISEEHDALETEADALERIGLHIVDAATFVRGGLQYEYYWLGMGPRDRHVTLCFVDTVRRIDRLCRVNPKVCLSVSFCRELLMHMCAIE
jgi:catechol 2,3-dioxygenase-like lactoylglutathione lyase family enzyme